jgi:hypothetical protein
MPYMPIDLTKTQGREVQAVADLGATTAYRLQQLYLTMTSAHPGAEGDWTTFEGVFGVPAGRGLELFELMENALGDVQNAANIQVAMATIGGRIRSLHPVED